jgi:fibronectin-binding autotransporter adhesin
MLQHRVRIRFLFSLLACTGLVEPALGATFTWTGGGGANTNWSQGANWGGSAPANGATDLTLVFPALTGPYKSNNDLTGLRVVALSAATKLGSGDYTFTGNPITLAGPVNFASPESGNPNLRWQLPVSLGSDVTIHASGRQTRLQGTIALADHTLTLACEGDILLTGAVSGSGGITATGPGVVVLNSADAQYAGATRVDAGTLQLDADLSSSAALTIKSGATLKGNGSTGGTIVVESGATLAPGTSPGALASQGLTMASGATYAVEINGAQAGAQHDTLAVSGAVTLGGATLSVALGYAPPDGSQFAIITAPSAAGGNFAGLAEGASLQLGNSHLTIGYHGGAGGNVVLVAGPPPTATRTGTAVGSATVTATPTPTFTPTPTSNGPCTGDCDGNGAVTVNEVVLGVSVALGGTVGPPCEAIDADGDGRASIAELIAAVGNALDGC